MKKIIQLITMFFFSTLCFAESQATDSIEKLSEASEYIQEKNYEQALKIMDNYIYYDQRNPEAHFLYCLLKERTEKPYHQVMGCYREVIKKISSMEGKDCSENINCIISKLMAEDPKAHEMKSNFLENNAKSAENEVNHFLLKDFNRKSFLNSILP